MDILYKRVDTFEIQALLDLGKSNWIFPRSKVLENWIQGISTLFKSSPAWACILCGNTQNNSIYCKIDNMSRVESKWIWYRLYTEGFGFMLFEDAHLDIICFIMFRFVCIEYLEFSANNIFISWWYMHV